MDSCMFCSLLWTAHEMTANLCAFSKLSYWDRIWVLQELSLAREVLVVGGAHWAPLSVFVGICQSSVWISSIGDKDESYLAQDPPASTLSHLGQSVRKLQLRQVLLIYAANTTCEDPRDKVYALRNMVSNLTSSQLQPDYTKSIYDLY